MNVLHKAITQFIRSPITPAILCGVAAALVPDAVLAQFYNGPGILGGLQHAQAVGGVTDRNIREVVLNILLAVLLYMGLAAVVVIVIAGIWLVLSVGDEQAKEKAKKIILYAVAGLIVIALAAAIVLVIINATNTGGIFGPVPSLGGGTARDPRDIILGIMYGILLYMGLAAVVVIVLAGIYMVVSLGDEQAVGRAKKIILYAVIGLIIIALAGAIVYIVAEATGAGGIFGAIPDTGGSGSISNPRQKVVNILKGVLSFMALAAVVVIVIAGIYMVVSLGNEQNIDKAKKIIFWAIVGLIVILLAQAIVAAIASLV